MIPHPQNCIKMDGEPLNGVVSIEIRAAVGEPTRVTLVMHGTAEIEADADVEGIEN
jgi:hypothetical protein